MDLFRHIRLPFFSYAACCWMAAVAVPALHAPAHGGNMGFSDGDSSPAPSPPAKSSTQPRSGPLSSPSVADAQRLKLGSGSVWIVFASRQDLNDAQELARRYSALRNDVRIFRAVNGWYTVVAGPVSRESGETAKNSLVSKGVVPADTYLAEGSRWVEDVTTRPAVPKPAIEPIPDNSSTLSASDIRKLPCMDKLANHPTCRYWPEHSQLKCSDNDFPYSSVYRLSYSSATCFAVCTSTSRTCGFDEISADDSEFRQLAGGRGSAFMNVVAKVGENKLSCDLSVEVRSQSDYGRIESGLIDCIYYKK
jgi:hypothetical protein